MLLVKVENTFTKEVVIKEGKTIGVVTGHGFPCTAHFYQYIVDSMIEEKQAKDSTYPSLLTYNSSLDVVSTDGSAVDEKMVARELNLLEKMFKGQVEEIIILCNTLHQFSQQIEERTLARVVSLPQSVLERVPAESDILVFCSEETKRNKLYGSHVTYKELPEIIERCSQGKKVNADIVAIRREIDHFSFYAKNPIVILGCTDLTLHYENLKDYPIKVIDSVKVASEVATEKS